MMPDFKPKRAAPLLERARTLDDLSMFWRLWPWCSLLKARIRWTAS